MKAMNRRKLITASAVLAVVGLAATAIPAQAAEVGVSSTQIKLGMPLLHLESCCIQVMLYLSFANSYPI
jgi:hypothetical protein